MYIDKMVNILILAFASKRMIFKRAEESAKVSVSFTECCLFLRLPFWKVNILQGNTEISCILTSKFQ